MSTASTATPDCSGPNCAMPSAQARTSWWLRIPGIPLVLSLALLAFVFFPPVSGNPRLVWAFAGTAAGLLVWLGILWFISRRSARPFAIELSRPQKSHYIQAAVQFSIYAYWGWYWRNVYEAAPLILAQLVFLYNFEALLTWSRGRNWRLGCGVMPIIFSTNFFMWFKDDWFIFQFAMLAVSALGKEFIRWNRDGRSTHIFNPSAFGLAVCSIVLIFTGTTRLTWGIEVATTLARPPHIFLEIFLLGLVVQYFFSVTLMTFAAVASLTLAGLVYGQVTGSYFFVDTNIPIAIFLGMHLLLTDPATSPRSNFGRVVFGTAYGLANFVLFWALGGLGIPDFYDKLIPVPILNLCVPWIDRIARAASVERLMRWERSLQPRKLNLIYMGGWATFFFAMLGTGYVDAPHEGSTISYWKTAHDEGKPFAGRNLVKMVGSAADAGNGQACNQLGVFYLEGQLIERDQAAAAHYFARACALGNLRGCENVIWQFFSARHADSPQAVAAALDRLEQELGKSKDGRRYALVGFAYETGQGRAADPARALELYRAGCGLGNLDAVKGRVRLSTREPIAGQEVELIERLLEHGRAAGDAESCNYLAHMYERGVGVRVDPDKAARLLEEACGHGSQAACLAVKRKARSIELSPSIGRS